jgi:two-component system chemotaxis sensor kinase CheA
MTTEGGETELDKTVIERLSDPLVHIIRNSIDHGIELPEIREKEGKPSQGTVKLSAVHSGANVLIRISDDGKGLDPEAIRAKAVNLGIMSPEEELTEKEIFAKIFAPGFSTAEKVTDVSGRGVGMDVVKQGIDALRGTIEINSEKGRGVTVTLKLPLTLAIIDGLLVEVGETFFILPLNTVEECKELTREDLVRANGRNILNIRDEIVSFVPLRGLFGINGTKPPIEQIVIAELNGERIGFVVDEIIGEHQTVIKNLGKICKEAKGVSGATILADGTVALILDVNSLSETALLEEQSRAVA